MKKLLVFLPILALLGGSLFAQEKAAAEEDEKEAADDKAKDDDGEKAKDDEGEKDKDAGEMQEVTKTYVNF